MISSVWSQHGCEYVYWILLQIFHLVLHYEGMLNYTLSIVLCLNRCGKGHANPERHDVKEIPALLTSCCERALYMV